MLKKCAIAAPLMLVLLLMPASAHADWLFTPNIGSSFGGSASGNEHMSWGASIGWMGAGVFGWKPIWPTRRSSSSLATATLISSTTAT